jgi:pimeloyl-ACP methyl ester carboxylesterase
LLKANYRQRADSVETDGMLGDRSVRNGAGETFGGRSRWTDVDGPVHYLDFGGPSRAPVIVAVHGLGGSAVNWSAIAPLLTSRYRLIAPDLAGFGLTRLAGRDATVFANRALLHRFIESVPAAAKKPVILMGNSMGGMICVLEASAAPETVAALILVDSALPFVLARPDPLIATTFALYGTPGLGGLMRSLRRDMPPDVQVARLLSVCCADSSRVPALAVAQHVEMERRRADFPDKSKALTVAARSVVHTIGRRRGHAYRATVDSVRCPVLLLQGDRDRLVPVSVARAAARAHPDWTLAVLTGIGHVPQLETPGETAELIIGWLGQAAPGEPGVPGRHPAAGRAARDAQAASGLRAAAVAARRRVAAAAGRARSRASSRAARRAARRGHSPPGYGD